MKNRGLDVTGDCYATCYTTCYMLLQRTKTDKVVLLECEQDYRDLDMQVNSGFNNLRRLSGEPIYIVERKDLEISGGEIRRKMREEVKEDWEIDN